MYRNDPVFGLGIALFIMTPIYYFAIPQSLGAHHFWAQKVVLIGTPIGLILSMFFRYLSIPYLIRILLFASLTVIGYWLAMSGGQQFAASFAEDRIAGKFWYYGWIGTMTALSATVATTFTR